MKAQFSASSRDFDQYRPHQRIRASRIEAQVSIGGRVLEPHRLAATRPAPPGPPGLPSPAGPAGLAPQHRDLVTENHNLRVLGRLAPAQQHQPAKDPDHDQIEQPDAHEPRYCPDLTIWPNRRSHPTRQVLKRTGFRQLSDEAPPRLSKQPGDRRWRRLASPAHSPRPTNPHASPTPASRSQILGEPAPAHVLATPSPRSTELPAPTSTGPTPRASMNGAQSP